MIPSTPKNLLISTPGAVREISFSPVLKEQARSLKKAAKTWYYPMLALKHLHALSVEPGAKNNVFFPNVKDFRANVAEKVVVHVPGIQATVERQENDSWVVTALALDDEHRRIGLRAVGRPGVYAVSKSSNEIKVDYKPNGRFTNAYWKKVVVADTQYIDVQDAAENAFQHIEAIYGRTIAQTCNFDLFFSPVGSRLGNVRDYNPLVLTQSYAFAGMLADTIELTANTVGVGWASYHSGSAVLTQALEALSVKGPLFKGKSHVVRMCVPQTDPKPLLVAVKQLGMIAYKDTFYPS